jgi:hypothetical protein
MEALVSMLLSIANTFRSSIDLYGKAERQKRERAAAYLGEIADTLDKAVASMQEGIVPAGLIAELEHELKNLAVVLEERGLSSDDVLLLASRLEQALGFDYEISKRLPLSSLFPDFSVSRFDGDLREISRTAGLFRGISKTLHAIA